MATLISSGSETLLASLQTQSTVALDGTAPARAVDRPATPGRDTVELSTSARVRQLVQQGQDASQIANVLGLTASLVNGYLYAPVNPVIVSGVGAGGSSAVPRASF